VALSLRFGAVSDIGRVRKKNDDSGYAGPHLIVVADGMGGAPAGDVASAIVIQTLKRLDSPPPDDLLQALAGTILIANERLAEVIEDDPSIEGMGTTLTAVLFDGSQIGVAHLGDSRGYLWRDGELLRITHDHSWVQSLIDEGRITEQEANTHSHRSLLLKVLDGRHDNEPDLSTYDVRAGDRILICSDGLTGFVSTDRIERALQDGTPQTTAAALTKLALESGSTDNVTVLVGDVVDGDHAAAGSSEPIIVGAALERHRSPLVRRRGWSHRDEPETHELLLADSSLDPEELRYAFREPRRLLWLRRTAALLVLVALVAGGLVLGYRWTQRQYFVGADGGRVAIYRGVNAEVPGIDLNHVYADQHLRLSQLRPYQRSQVLDGLDADSLARAQQIIAHLQLLATRCAGATTTPAGPSVLPTVPHATTATVPPGHRPSAPVTIAPPTALQPATPPAGCHGHSADNGTAR
jgi:protein phosphatase